MMDRRITKALTRQKKARCAYCFCEFQSISEREFCPFCELPLFGGTESAHIINSQINGIGTEFRRKLDAGDYDGAESDLIKLMAQSGNPILNYVYGTFCIMSSNAEISKIRYDLEGFMERNTMFRDSAAKGYARARAAMHSYLYIYETAPAKDLYATYAAFLAYSKLGMERPASLTLESIKNADKPGHVYRYARMLRHSYSKMYKELLTAAKKMTTEEPNHNSLFYMAFALLKTKKASEALKMAEYAAQSLKDKRYLDIANDAKAALSTD